MPAFRRPRPRRGFTLFELIAVMAVLLLLAAVVLPSIGSFRGDANQRAAADVIRGELAVARARAMEQGVPYRVAVTEDGSRIRRAPDSLEFADTAPGADRPDGSVAVIEYEFRDVKVLLAAGADAAQPTADAGWVTVATVMPDGTCREDAVLLEIKEDNKPSMFVRVRGVTASSKVVPASAAPNGGAK